MRWLSRWGLLLVGGAAMLVGAIVLITAEAHSAPEQLGGALGAPAPALQPGLGVAVALIAAGLVVILVWFAIRFGRRR